MSRDWSTRHKGSPPKQTQQSHKRRSSEACICPEHVPTRAGDEHHDPLASDWDDSGNPWDPCERSQLFFLAAQLHEIKRFRGRHQIGCLRYFECGWNAHFRMSLWYLPLVSSSEWSGGLKSDGRPSLHRAIPIYDADVTFSRHRPNSCCLRGRNRASRVAFCLQGGQWAHVFVHRLSVGQRRHSPPAHLDRRSGHSLALRRTVAAGPPPWASKNGHWPPHPSPQWGAPAPAGGASAPTLKFGAPPPNPHLNMVVVG